MLGFWIVQSWVREFTIVILFSQLLLSSFSNYDELISVLLVREIFIEVILKVLNHVHVLLHEVISSYSVK